MKKITRISSLLCLLFISMSAFSQQYKNIDDTAKLNKEYTKVSNDIVALNAKLIIAQNNLPGYQAKVKDAMDDASNAANASSDQASQATSGSVSDAKKAKRKAKKAYNEAKDSRLAKKRLSNQEDKITAYQLSLRKKEQRLAELDLMRTAILQKTLSNPIP